MPVSIAMLQIILRTEESVGAMKWLMMCAHYPMLYFSIIFYG